MSFHSTTTRWLCLALLLGTLAVGCTATKVTLNTDDPTAMGRWTEAWQQIVPEPTLLQLRNAQMIGPFDHTEYRGYDEVYPPEQTLASSPSIDFGATATGKDGETVQWKASPGLESTYLSPLALSLFMPSAPESVLYVYAEIEVQDPQLAELRFGGPDSVEAWLSNGPDAAWHKAYAPAISWPFTDLEHNRALIGLQAGTNRLMLKLMYTTANWSLQVQTANYGDPQPIVSGVDRLISGAPDPTTRMVARYKLVEIEAAMDQQRQVKNALAALKRDPLATDWDVTWADAVAAQADKTGSYMPIHDVNINYQPVTSVTPYDSFWPQSSAPAQELMVLDVSSMSPQMEFAMSVLQGLVNRTQPRLYLLHTRYSRQDWQWLQELVYEGYTYRDVSVDDVWNAFRSEISGAVIYDGSIMDEIGAYHSDQLNQTNVLMMISSLQQAVPLTEEMNKELGLPVLFDARGKWANQYDMMSWAYRELFPQMNHRIVATDYPGIFLLTDYLVENQIFTFWFPQERTQPEENLLRGILASTPPNTPIVGWWFDWMPNPQDPVHKEADAVMEAPGLIRGSYFGKVLTPSHEATNLSVHSGVAVGPWEAKSPPTPEFDPTKVYYAHVISDGDNLGEALMMRTRDLQWDKPQRGDVPMGWSFAPGAARMAPTVLNYYLRTATPNDLLVGGLGVGYTEPDVYLRAYPDQRDSLYTTYAKMTSDALGWIDTDCLWLIRGTQAAEDRYAEGAPGTDGNGRLKGIFNGYGGSPQTASVRIAPNNVVVFHPATGMTSGKSREELINRMVYEIQEAAGHKRPAFVEAWVLNWAWSMDMLMEVQDRLGPEYVGVRPDVLVSLAQRPQ